MAAGIRYRVYTLHGAFFIHPDGDEACRNYHRRGEQCPCEFWEYAGVGAVPQGYFIEETPGLGETGYTLTYQGKTYEVLSVE